MKIKFLTTFIMMIICNIECKSQTHIINMAGGNGTLPFNYNETGDYYIKDMNNYLDNFTGTWEYVNGNEKTQIILLKKIKHHTNYPDLPLNYYEDGLLFQYKRFTNNTLIYESPMSIEPWFTTKDGVLLEGGIKDYGRITKTIQYPLMTKPLYPGGGPVDARCDITKVSNNQIKFHLYLRQEFPNYDDETYAGQPIFSLPNDVIMTKVP